MQSREQKNRGINRILSQCNNREIVRGDIHYFMQKTHQLKEFQRYFNTTMDNIKKIERDESESDDERYESNAEMAQTIYARLTNHKFISTKTLLDHQKNKRVRFQSLPTQNLRYKKRSQDSIQQWISKSNAKLNLPSLIFKVKKSKQPSNASKNMKLQYDSKNQNKEEEVDITYEQIKIERRKIQEKRHLFIIGKVMDQNYRKQIRNLWNLKRTNRAIKLKKYL